MHTDWAYTLRCPPPDFDAAVIEAVLALAAARGYSAVNPGYRTVRGVHSDARGAFAFPETASAVALLAAEGGLLELWKGDVDLGLWLPPPARRAGVPGPAPVSDSPRMMSLNVDGAHFRPDRHPALSRATAADLRHLFAALAAHFGLPYGYVEAHAYTAVAFADPTLDAAIATGRAPGALYALQYFSDAYAASAGAGKLAELGGQLEKTSQGVLISFADDPWDADPVALAGLHARWLADTPRPPG